ncbi:MAG: phenylalanine--tRNA ligase subunit beta [Candidatus Margulisiibacteriota bacterium]
MKVPIDWLKELITFRAGPDQLADWLSMAGLETVALEDDILDVDVLPNRADAWSIRGIAREVSAITKFKLKPVKIHLKESRKKVNEDIKVEVRNRDLCPRYMARVIRNVKVGESPQWLKQKLLQAGMRPINNIVDVTNCLLLEIGQPMHAFDANLIADKNIIVRQANPEEKMAALDGKEYILDTDTLVISDPEKVLAIAGVIGGASSEVGPATKNVVLESAYFNSIAIHKTLKRLKIRTESSIRFEYGVDWNGVEEALDRGAALIAQLGRGEVLKGKIDTKAKELPPRIIELRLAQIGRILGVDIPVGEIVSILGRLGFDIIQKGKETFKISVPSYRYADIEREIDLIEEIARIHGYGRFEMTMPNTAFFGKGLDPQDQINIKVREILVGAGLNEVNSYSMLGPKDFEAAGIPLGSAVEISNPMNVGESLMRSHILPGLLKTAVHNLNRQVENVFIFEIGKVSLHSSEEAPLEKWALGALMIGSPFMSALDKGVVDYLYTKGIVEDLFNSLGISGQKFTETVNFLVQPGKGAAVEGIGLLGAVHPEILRGYDISQPAYFFEIDLDALAKLVAGPKKYVPLPKYPSTSRDISMFIPANLENGMIIDLIKKLGGELVEAAYPFDKYKDSIAYRIIYRNRETTITELEVNERHSQIVEALVSKLKVRIR